MGRTSSITVNFGGDRTSNASSKQQVLLFTGRIARRGSMQVFCLLADTKNGFFAPQCDTLRQ